MTCQSEGQVLFLEGKAATENEVLALKKKKIVFSAIPFLEFYL